MDQRQQLRAAVSAALWCAWLILLVVNLAQWELGKAAFDAIALAASTWWYWHDLRPTLFAWMLGDRRRPFGDNTEGPRPGP